MCIECVCVCVCILCVEFIECVACRVCMCIECVEFICECRVCICIKCEVCVYVYKVFWIMCVSV